MKRRQLCELEDLPWWPRIFRNACTDYLETVIRVAQPYQSLAPRLARAIRHCGATEVLDLCSGAGGPWPTLLPALREQGCDPTIHLSDKFPNTAAFERIARQSPGIQYVSTSVSAEQVPAKFTGFRTLFTAMHHFQPVDAMAILTSAVRDRRGIAVFEFTARSKLALALMCLTPLMLWLLTPLIRPFRWSRLFWTYLIPIIPLAVLFDGIISCLRTYTPNELQSIAATIDNADYVWETGFESVTGSPVPVTYLIGVPRIGSQESITARIPILHAVTNLVR